MRCGEFIDCPVVKIIKLSKENDAPLPNERTYINKVPTKKKKIDDVGNIQQCILQECLSFYEDRLCWPTADGEESTDDDV